MKRRAVYHPDYNLTAKQLVNIAGVDIRTARRWVQGKQNIHPAFHRLIQLEVENRILPKDSEVRVTGDKKGIILDCGQYIFEFAALKRLWIDLQRMSIDRNKLLQREVKLKPE